MPQALDGGGPMRPSAHPVVRSHWTARKRGSELRNLLGFVMAAPTKDGGYGTSVLCAVALLRDLPDHGLVRGQVGTIIETLDENTALVEFSDDRGEAYAIAPCSQDTLLVLRTIPRATQQDAVGDTCAVSKRR